MNPKKNRVNTAISRVNHPILIWLRVKPFRASTEYVNGRRYETYLSGRGMDCTGMNTPLRNNIGNLKKFDKVWASKTSFTDTATRAPRAESVNKVKQSAVEKSSRLVTRILKKITARAVITMDIIPPKMAPPRTLANRIE